jgi:hypothetical protein
MSEPCNYTCRKISPSLVGRYKYKRWGPDSRGTGREGKPCSTRRLVPPLAVFVLLCLAQARSYFASGIPSNRSLCALHLSCRPMRLPSEEKAVETDRSGHSIGLQPTLYCLLETKLCRTEGRILGCQKDFIKILYV